MKNIFPKQRIGNLVIIEEVNRSKSRDRQYLVACDCGERKVMSWSNLSRETKGPKSCGCLKTKHGKWKTRAYTSWSGMMKRCYSESTKHYSRYGGRGITVCERWHTFENFIADMGEPNDGFSIERIDNNAGYSPENCKWATTAEQARNRRSTVIIEHDGLRMCLQDWADHVGLPVARVRARIKIGWTHDQALGFEPRAREATLLKSQRKEEAIALRRQGLTHRQIAEKIGIDSSVVCRYLNEKSI
jgi:hypothetical protein